MPKRHIHVGLILGFFLLMGFAHAEELPTVFDSSIAHAVYSEGQTFIPGLTWEGTAKEPTVTIEGQESGKPAARLNGRFEGKNAGTLLFSSEIIQRANFKDENGNFTVLIPLINRKTPVKIKYIDDYGNQQAQDIEIVYENFFHFQLNQPPKKKWNFDAGASLSYLAYQQTASTSEVSIKQIGLTPKFGVIYNASSKFDIGASAFVTLIGLPLSKSPTTNGGVSTPRFYGVNLRVGYKIYSLNTGNIYIMTGPYFWGMIVPPSPNGMTFGVVKLTGPQLFVVGRFLTPEGRTAVGYLKAASILDGDGGLMQNREYALGGAYQLTPPKSKRRIMMNLDFADAKFFITGETIKLTSLSLGLSTSF